MVTLLLPLNRYKVKYQLGRGRPYSDLERLVLRAFKEENARTIQDLQNIFCLPNRLIVEVLVTLAQAGWIAIGNNRDFILTSQGKAALDSPEGKLPPGTSVRSEETFIMMERLTGELVSPSQIIYQNTSLLKREEVWTDACRLPVKITDKNLGIDRVQHLLPRNKREGERIRFIDSPRLISQDYYCLAMNADLQQQRIIGLPDSWEGNLKELLLDYAENFVKKHPELADKSYEGVRQVESKFEKDESGIYFAKIELDDLLLTHNAHVEKLKKALVEEAETTILIASAFLKIDNLSKIREWMLAALKRGVNVDLLWGYRLTEQSEKTTVKWLEELGKEAQKLTGKLRFNEDVTNSHAKLLIYDTKEGYRAYVGSYNWLSTPTEVSTDVDGSNVTVGLDHPGLVADLCFSVASLWDVAQKRLSSDAPGHWQRIAAQLQETTEDSANENSNTSESQISKARIVHAREHEGLMRQYLGNAKRRCLVVSHQIDPDKQVASFRLIECFQEVNSLIPIVLYGDKERLGEQETDFKQQVREINGVLQYIEGLHSKIVVADDVAIISSYNFLSGDPFGKAKRVKEIGVLIEGGEVADKLWEVFYEHSGLSKNTTE